MDPVLSIVIPVYNVEAYLPCCLDSLVSQKTSLPYEVILVDDGSPDGSGAICDGYAARYPFVSVHHQRNSGPGATRNLGLDHARGSLVSFVDSDDWVSPLYVETLVSEMGAADLLYFGLRTVRPCGGRESVYPGLGTFSGRDDVERVLCSLTTTTEAGNGINELFGYSWNKVFRLDIVNRLSLRFACISVREDELFTLGYCAACNSLKIVPDVLYYYRIVSSSLTRSKKPLQHYVALYSAVLSLRGSFSNRSFYYSLTSKALGYMVDASLASRSFADARAQALSARSLWLQDTGKIVFLWPRHKLLVWHSSIITSLAAWAIWLVRRTIG